MKKFGVRSAACGGGVSHRRCADHAVVLILALLLTILPACAFSQNEPGVYDLWPQHMNRVLGIEPDARPLKGTVDFMFDATVVDAGQFAAAGMADVKNGDRLRLTHLGGGVWRIKHYVSGIAFEIDLNPPRNNSHGG